MIEQIDKIRKAYDLLLDQYHSNIHPFDNIPDDFKQSQEFKELINNCVPAITGSANPDIKRYLAPIKGYKLLDIGCSANLANYKFGEWNSSYYGIDISSALIHEMKKYTMQNNLNIGGLFVAEIANMPFKNDMFELAMIIGVLEYYDHNYIYQSLKEVNRVLKDNSKLVIDIPNEHHRLIDIMVKLEHYLNRPVIITNRKYFERIIKEDFQIDDINDLNVMIKYYLRNRK